jgi:alkaline phosphatase D
LLRRLFIALTAFLGLAALTLTVLVGLALAGHPIPLARAVAIAANGMGFVDELLHPLPPDDEALHDPARPTITHGIASGDVTATSAVIWTRASGPATMHVAYDLDPGFTSPRALHSAIRADADFTGIVVLRDLQPNTEYRYRVWLSPTAGGTGAVGSEVQQGAFRTAAAADEAMAVSFVYGGDLGGGGYCRHSEAGYPIFEAMQRLSPTFFLALGDMIYADNLCPRRRPDGASNIPGTFRAVDHRDVAWGDLGQLRPIYWAHWRYNRTDPSFQRLLASTPLYGMWDDHEVINNFGGGWSFWRSGVEDRTGFPNLVVAGRDALFAYTPIDRHADEPDRLYRSFTWGRDLELFVLDVRSYRSRNDEEDTPERAKTMLGAQQLAWLKHGLARSRATWKVVASGVPLSAPTSGPGALVFGRDGWASGSGADAWSRTGFERELLDVLRHLDEERVENIVFVAADLHQALAIRYSIDLDGDGLPLAFHEFVAGPLSAPTRAQPPDLDPTLSPSLLFSEGGRFNFGYVRIQPAPEGGARLTFDVRGEDGVSRPGSTIELAARGERIGRFAFDPSFVVPQAENREQRAGDQNRGE